MASHVPQAMRKQVKEANRMAAALAAGQDPFAGKGPPPTAAPSNPSPGPTLQPVPEFAVVGDSIPPGFVPVDLTRGDPRAQPPAAAPPSAQAPAVNQPPTNPSSRWVPASEGNKPAQPPQARPAAAPAPGATAQPPAGSQPVAEDPRYKVLQGKYNTEVRDLRGQVQDLMAMNRQLLAAMQARPAAVQPAPPPAPKTTRERAIAAGFTEKEIDEFGEDLVNMMLRTAENIAGPQVAQLRQENARLASTVSTTVQSVTRNATERFWDDLADLVPDWAEINASQEWLDWLQQPDVFSGRTRNDGLQSAFAEHNARRVAGIFNTFKAEDVRAGSTAGGQHLDPATLIAPGQPAASTPAPAGNDADTKIWTEEEVRQFYSAVRRGHIKGEAKAREEARINLALVQGRIRPDHNDAFLINAR